MREEIAVLVGGVRHRETAGIIFLLWWEIPGCFETTHTLERHA